MEKNNVIQELVEKFLEFENNSDVLKFHYQYRNMLIWPFIRVIVLNAILESNEKKGKEYNDDTTSNKIVTKILNYKWAQLFKINKNPLFCKKHSDILFLYAAVENVRDDSGKYYSRIHDDFVAMYDKTAIIERAEFFKHFYPKKYKTYESDSLEIVCSVTEKIVKLNKLDKIEIDNLFNYLKKTLPFKIDVRYWHLIRIVLERYAKNNKMIYQFYKKIFKNMQPKLVFVTEGCYGHHTACIIKVLKDLGIPCAEIQHGLVALSHCAYNFSDAIYKSEEYLEYMPDVFLTMGKYWMSQVRLPIKMEVLGNANFYRNKCKMNTQQAKEILILPSADTQAWVELVHFIGEQLSDKEITIKLHPLYKHQYETFSGLSRTLVNIKVYIDGNIYDYLNRAYVVIGDGTTVLYEAAALNKVVMVWNNTHSTYIDRQIGCWFDDKYELLELLKEPLAIANRGMIAPEDIFEYDIKINYLNFIKKYLDN